MTRPHLFPTLPDHERFDALMRHSAEGSASGHMAGYKVLARYYLNNQLDDYD